MRTKPTALSPTTVPSPAEEIQDDRRTLLVHRCKAVEHNPAGIVSISVTPESSVQTKQAAKAAGTPRRSVTIACARANGDVELWNPQGQGWFLERMIPGSANSPIESVLWVHQNDVDPAASPDEFDMPEERKAFIGALHAAAPRLVTAGLDGRIIEWDLISMKPKQIAEVGGGAVWCAALNRQHTRLAIGSEDGHVRVLDVTDGRLEMLRLLERTPTRVMSIAWHPLGKILVTGGTNSSIRKMDVATGRTLQRMTTRTTGGEETIVWDVKILQDGTIVSGDSMGNVIFWNWKSGTPITTMRAHGADVLCIVGNKAGNKVWTSGVDRKVVQFSFVSNAASKGNRQVDAANPAPKALSKWIVSGDKRFHSHDVRALALMENRPYDALISGGVDTTLTVSTPLSEFPFLKQFRMPSFPHRSIVQMTTSGSRLMLARFQDHVKVWRLGKPAAFNRPDKLANYTPVDHQRETLLYTIKTKNATNLSAAAISEEGKWICISDMESVKLFTVDEPTTSSGVTRVRKVKEFEATVGAVLPAAHAVRFTPNSSRLIVAGCDSVIYVVDLATGPEGSFAIAKSFATHRGTDEARRGQNEMEMDGQVVGKAVVPTRFGREQIATLAVSGDGQWLASGDLFNRINVFNLDSLKHHATLPVFPSLHTTITFHPSSPTLVVTCTSNEFYLYDVDEARLTDWSREYSQRLPYRWLLRKEVVTGVAFDPRKPSSMVLHGAGHVTFVDLDKPIGPRDATILMGKRRLALYLETAAAKKRTGRGVADGIVKEENGAVGMEGVAQTEEEEEEEEDDTHELAALRNGEFLKRRQAAAREIRVKGVPAPTTSDDVILIASDPEDEDEDDEATPVTSTPSTPRSLNAKNGHPVHDTPARAGVKRSHPSSTSSATSPSIHLGGGLGTVPVDGLSEQEYSGAFAMEHRYGPVVGCQFVAEDELVVIERPVLSVLQGVAQGAYYKHKYGT
ncbi:U3 small nucleolar RNA-associated protein 4 [Thoreauomyces humboldtii]|nr:U3 small nucleolar RNA-associated protein 4 [Thoreauomyces humboldtii]